MNRSETSTQSTLPLNIPTVLTTFIGREREIGEIMGLLASSRLVTLRGAAGCGKTRLALRAATEVHQQYVDGIHWVELARLADARLVPQTVARAINVVEQPDRPLLEGLLDSLRDKQLLLVLDNCEHLLSACRELVETLLAAANISLLATSSETAAPILEAADEADQLDYERCVTQIGARLSQTVFEAEQAIGRALSLQQAIEYALSLKLPAPPAEVDTPSYGLTEREREVAGLIALGLPNGEIADQLVVSKRTVEKHIANILAKLSFTSRAQIVRWAIENGLNNGP